MTEQHQETCEDTGEPKDGKKPRRTSRLRRWMANLGLILGGCLVALFVVEVILRLLFYFPQPQFLQIDEVVGHRHRPGITGYYLQEGFSKYTINSHGFRDREYTVARPPETFRIVVLGDSFAEAIQVNLDETFHEILERQLEPAGVEVLNFGVSGYGTAQELLAYRHYARPFSPQLVILAFCSANDVSDNSKVLAGGYPRPYYTLRDGQLQLDNGFRQSRRHRFLRRYGAIYYFVSDHLALAQCADRWRRNAANRRRARRAEKASEKNPQPVEAGLSRRIYGPPATAAWTQAWDVTEQLLLELNREVERDGAKLVVMTVTLAIQVDHDLREKVAGEHPDWDIDYADRRIQQVCERNGIPCLVLAPLLLERSRTAKGPFHGFGGRSQGHWNARGHRAVGELLAGFLRDRGLVPSTGVRSPPSAPPEKGADPAPDPPQ